MPPRSARRTTSCSTSSPPSSSSASSLSSPSPSSFRVGSSPCGESRAPGRYIYMHARTHTGCSSGARARAPHSRPRRSSRRRRATGLGLDGERALVGAAAAHYVPPARCESSRRAAAIFSWPACSQLASWSVMALRADDYLSLTLCLALHAHSRAAICPPTRALWPLSADAAALLPALQFRAYACVVLYVLSPRCVRARV